MKEGALNDIDPRVRERLVCPTCRGELEDVPNGLRCAAEALVFPIVDGIPHLVAELSKREK